MCQKGGPTPKLSCDLFFAQNFVGSRYRSSTAVQQQTTTAQTGRLLTIAATIPAVHPPPPAPQQKPQVIAVGKPNSGARISPAMDSSGFGSSTSSNNSQQNSAEAELDLIDLFDEKCSIGKPKAASPPLLQPQHQFDGAVFPHTGVIASVDLKSSGGYYVYSNEFDSELYLPAEGELEQGTWIKFNILDTTYRPTVGQYALLKRSPFDVRVERNTICMRVRATITNEALVTRVVKTSYVNQVYDRNRLLQPSHLNKELQLEVRRGKFDGFYWAIGKIMMLVA